MEKLVGRTFNIQNFNLFSTKLTYLQIAQYCTHVEGVPYSQEKEDMYYKKIVDGPVLMHGFMGVPFHCEKVAPISYSSANDGILLYKHFHIYMLNGYEVIGAIKRAIVEDFFLADEEFLMMLLFSNEETFYPFYEQFKQENFEPFLLTLKGK